MHAQRRFYFAQLLAFCVHLVHHHVEHLRQEVVHFVHDRVVHFRQEVVHLVVPLVGQVWPTSMLFPLAYRHNSGNLRISQFLVKHSAQAKLENFITDGDMFYGERLPAADGGGKLSIGVLLH